MHGNRSSSPRLPAANRRAVSHFKRFFFANFFGLGVLMPYLALYLVNKGLTGAQMGLVLGVLPLVKILAQPLWGLLGDAYHLHRQLLTGGLLLLAGVALLLPLVQGFWPILLVVILFGFFDASYLPLGTTLALNYLEQCGQPESFGELRVWGSVGYIASAFGVGALLLDRSLESLPLVFAAANALAGVQTLFLPQVRGALEPFRWRAVPALLTGRPAFALFLAGIALCGATLAASMQYLPIYLEELHAAGWMIGLSIGLQALPELPLMARTQSILRRIGAPAALLIGVSVLPVRWLLHALIRVPAWLLPVQVLHGFTISGVMVAGALLVNHSLPSHLRATGQAVYATAFSGLGWSLGLLAAGVIYDHWGMTVVWVAVTLTSLAGVALVAYGLARKDTTA